MNPIFLILGVVALLAFSNKSNGAGADYSEENEAGYALQDLLHWGFDWADKLTAPELLMVHKFKTFERSGNWKEADKMIDQIKAIARKYKISI